MSEGKCPAQNVARIRGAWERRSLAWSERTADGVKVRNLAGMTWGSLLASLRLVREG